jgi:hypothetical protein
MGLALVFTALFASALVPKRIARAYQTSRRILQNRHPTPKPLNSYLELPTGYVKQFVKAKAEQGQERLIDAATGRPSVHRVPVSNTEQTTLSPLT